MRGPEYPMENLRGDQRNEINIFVKDLPLSKKLVLLFGSVLLSVISLLPILIFFIFFQKYLVDGIAMDGIKG